MVNLYRGIHQTLINTILVNRIGLIIQAICRIAIIWTYGCANTKLIVSQIINHFPNSVYPVLVLIDDI